MNKKMLMVGIIILFLTVELSGCNENKSKMDDTSKFIGVWNVMSSDIDNVSDITFTFNNDSTAKQVISNGNHIHWFNYEVDDNCLYLTLQDFPGIDAICYIYEFSNNNNTLILVNESLNTLTLTRQQLR